MNLRRARCGQYLDWIIRPCLVSMAVRANAPSLNSRGAAALLLGTALIESECGEAIVQFGGGPALGVWQMEPPTLRDHLRWIAQNKRWSEALAAVCLPVSSIEGQLPQNPLLACFLARVHYWRRDPGPMPYAEDYEEQAKRWGRYYQTQSIRAKMDAYVRKMRDSGHGLV